MSTRQSAARLGAVLAAGAGFPVSVTAQCQVWDTTVGSPGAELGDPTYGTAVRALEVFDDGTGQALYAAGSFTMMGGAAAHNIAKWDGAQWSALGEGLMAIPSSPGIVYDLQSFNDGSGPALYAAGWFYEAGGQPAYGVARWNGVSWQSLSGYTDGVFYKMGVLDNGAGARLHLGGYFSQINGVQQNSLVRWNGQTWEPVPGAPSLSSGSAVWGLGACDAPGCFSILVGGLSLVPGVVINQVPHGTLVFGIDGPGPWQYPGYGLEGDVGGGGAIAALTSMEVYDDGTGPSLYAGGVFNRSGFATLSNFAKFDGSQWSDVGGGVSGPAGPMEGGPTVWDMTAFGGDLYLGGGFTHAGGERALWLAAWDGQSFTEPGGGTDDTVYDLQVFDDGSGPSLFVAGRFTRVDPTGANLSAGGIARLFCDGGCYADCNGDSGLTVADFGCFQSRFVAGDPYADCNASGALTVADFGCFQSKFAAGCP